VCVLMSKNSLVDKGSLIVIIACVHSLASCLIYDMYLLNREVFGAIQFGAGD
jgi:hypothetical protein